MSAEAASPGGSRYKTVRTGLIISTVSVVILLAGLELAGYVWESRTAQGPLGWTLVASRRLEMELKGPADARYTLLVPGKTYEWEGIEVRIGPHGLRGPEPAVPKPAGTYRILSLGDSFVFGWEVAQEQTFGHVIEEQLNALGGPHHFEVVSAGVPTWNMETERNFLFEEGMAYQPDLLILSLAVVNDVYGEGVALAEDRGLLDWLRDETYLWPFLTTQMRFLLARQTGPEAIPVLNPPKNPEAYFPLRDRHPVYDRVWGYIEDMHASGVPMILVIFPTAFQLNSVGHPDSPQQAFLRRGAELGLPVLDLLPAFREACAEAGRDACEGYENALFADIWMHPNPVGHELAAREILAFIRGLGAELGLP